MSRDNFRRNRSAPRSSDWNRTDNRATRLADDAPANSARSRTIGKLERHCMTVVRTPRDGAHNTSNAKTAGQSSADSFRSRGCADGETGSHKAPTASSTERIIESSRDLRISYLWRSPRRSIYPLAGNDEDAVRRIVISQRGVAIGRRRGTRRT